MMNLPRRAAMPQVLSLIEQRFSILQRKVWNQSENENQHSLLSKCSVRNSWDSFSRYSSPSQGWKLLLLASRLSFGTLSCRLFPLSLGTYRESIGHPSWWSSTRKGVLGCGACGRCGGSGTRASWGSSALFAFLTCSSRTLQTTEFEASPSRCWNIFQLFPKQSLKLE